MLSRPVRINISDLRKGWYGSMNQVKKTIDASRNQDRHGSSFRLRTKKIFRNCLDDPLCFFESCSSQEAEIAVGTKRHVSHEEHHEDEEGWGQKGQHPSPSNLWIHLQSVSNPERNSLSTWFSVKNYPISKGLYCSVWDSSRREAHIRGASLYRIMLPEQRSLPWRGFTLSHDASLKEKLTSKRLQSTVDFFSGEKAHLANNLVHLWTAHLQEQPSVQMQTWTYSV